MKILLIKPRFPSDAIVPPLGLGYLAKVVKPNHKVKIINCLKDNISRKKLLNLVGQYKPDLVGVQVYNVDKEITYNYLKRIKELNRNIITIVGGPYPSCEPENVFEFFNRYLNFAFCGEAEAGFMKLVNKISGIDKDIEFADIDGLLWKNNGKVFRNKNVYIKNLDEIGAPDWDLLEPETYPPSPVGAFLKKFPVAPINVSRGCPFRCGFCAGFKISGHIVRYRSAKNVTDEIKMLYDKFGIREFHILDDNFTYRREYVWNFCNLLNKYNLDIKLACPNGVRMDTLDEEVLKLMKKTGFYSIHIGIESGSQQILNYMGKVLTLEKIKEKVDMINKIGMDVCGYFILGYPEETLADIKNTIKLAIDLPLSRAMFMNFLPIPGTRIYDYLKKNNKLHKINLYNKTFYNVNFIPDEIHPLQLKFLQLKAFLWFYIRPKIIIINFRNMYNFKHMLFLIRRTFRILINV